EVSAQALRAGHVRGPGIALAEEGERGVDGEVRWRDVVEVLPGDWKGDRNARADSGAVCGDHGGAADSRGVHEDLAAPVRLDEGGGGDFGIELFGPSGDGAGGGGRVLGC